jgi:translation initiation factor 2 alpha subunit (eIF-2alpha)
LIATIESSPVEIEDMHLRLKSAQLSVLTAIFGCCLMTYAAHADPPPLILVKPQMAQPTGGQSDNSPPVSNGQASPNPTPDSSSPNAEQGAGAHALQGKLVEEGGNSKLQGKAQAEGKGAPSQMLKGKTSASGPLQGGIHATGVVLPAFKLHMTQDQLKMAVAQYAADLRQFYMDAKDYHLAQESLKKQIGECTENQQQWEAKLSKDKLQLNSVVIATGIPNMPPPPPTPPNIPPPRVCCVGCLITGRCGHLAAGGGGGGSSKPTVNGYDRGDAIRMQQAGADLAKTKNNLTYSEHENAYTSQKAIDESKVEQSQQNLAEKFGRLQQEFDTLKIEKSALTGVSVK